MFLMMIRQFFVVKSQLFQCGNEEREAVREDAIESSVIFAMEQKLEKFGKFIKKMKIYPHFHAHS